MPAILPETARRAASALLDALLPSSCLLCGADAGDLLCAACAGDLPSLGSACPQCAESTTHGERCGRCLAHPPHFDAVVAPYRYAFPIDRLIHAFKYGGELALGRYFAGRLAAVIGERRFDLAIPMPLHADRLRERGFNQAAEIARPLAAVVGARLDLDALQRTRHTPPQADLDHRDRARNVRGAFECRHNLAGLAVLLVDDVMTTGATADECARVLKLHGTASVTVAVVARALRN